MNILRMIMSYGSGYMLAIGTKLFLCVGAFPSLEKACTQVNMMDLVAFAQAGFIPTLLGTTIYGTIVYYLSLKGSRN